MKRIKSYLIWAVVAASFVIIGGSVRYYFAAAPDMGLLYKIFASLQNWAETLLFNPVITVEDYASAVGSTGFGVKLFGFALALAPVIDLFIVFSVFNSVLYEFLDIKSIFSARVKRVLVVGKNPEIERIIDEKVKGRRVYRWCEEILEDEKKKDYLHRGILYKENDFSLGDSKGEYASQVKKFNRFLRRRRISEVLLLDESDSHNIQYYMALSSCEICKEKTIRFSVLINDFEMRVFLQEYFDKKLKEKLDEAKKAGQKNIQTHMDINIFNLQQLNAEKAFESLPLHTNTGEDEAVHLLIIGGGYAGEAFLIHAMNQGVITESNDITIDVIDLKTEGIRKRLLNRFNSDYVIFDEDKNTFEIGKDKCDGNLRIRLTECDVFDDNFVKTLQSLQETENGGRITYMALCLINPNANLHVMTALEKSGVMTNKIPIIARMSYTKQMEEFFKTFSFCSTALLIGENDEYIGLDEITDYAREKRMREYNACYDYICGKKVLDSDGGKADINVCWNKNPYYKRESNRALYYHRTVKDYFTKRVFINTESSRFWKVKLDDDSLKNNCPDLFLSERLIDVDENGKLKYPMLLKYAKAEHRRFCYFYASQGWGFIDATKKDEKNKLQNCLCTWAELEKKRDNNDVSRRQMLIYDLLSAPELMQEVNQTSDNAR